MTFLFVCSGNTCRSPMARALFEKRCADLGVSDLRALSAGLFAQNGERASADARHAVQAYGGSLEGHAARMFTRDLARGRVVLCMTRDLLRAVKAIAPEAEAYAFCAYAGLDGDIPDPYLQGPEAYARCARKIMDGVEKIIENGGEHA